MQHLNYLDFIYSKAFSSSVHTQGTYPYYSRDKGRVSATQVKSRE